MNTAEKLYFDPHVFLESLFNDLKQCQSSVDIEMYIWQQDDLTQRLEEIFFELAERGVRVRLLLDAVGSYTWLRYRKDEVTKRGVAVRVFHPLPGLNNLLSFTAKFGRNLNTINQRNHRKLIILDKKIAYVGSFNMMAISEDWRETIVKIDAATVLLMNGLFETAWRRAHNIFSEICKIRSTRVADKHRLLKFINQAKKRIWLVTPYFNPPRSLLRAIYAAANRGVAIKLLLPEHSDVPYMRWLAQQHYIKLIQTKVKIYEYQPRVLHAKTAIIDNIGIVGTTNLNHRSFFKDAELDVVLAQRESCFELANQFRKDLQVSKRILAAEPVPIWKKAATTMLYYVKDSL